MKRPAELDDFDRKYVRMAEEWQREVGLARPMSKRIPSPYLHLEAARTNHTLYDREPKRTSGAWPAAIAFVGLCLASAACVAVGAVTIVRWAWGLL